MLITGQLGYIGSHLFPHFKNDWNLQCCDYQNPYYSDFSEIRDQEFDAIIHLAASASVTQSLNDPYACLNNNAFKLIPFIKNNKIGKFIFASTGGAIYGDRHFAKENEASWAGCRSPYGQSKFLAEEIIRRLCPNNHCILRLGNVYGGHDEDRAEWAAHTHFRKDDPIVVYGGDQCRDFVRIETVCQAFVQAAKYGGPFGTYNIGSGVETKVSFIAQQYGRERNVEVVYKPKREGEIDFVSLDVSSARQAGLL